VNARLIHIKARTLPKRYEIESLNKGMTAVTAQNDTEVAKNRPAQTANPSAVSPAQIALIVLGVIGAIALASYQFFFCAGCYS